MTVSPRFEWQRPSPARRRRPLLRWIALGVALAAAFAIGVAVGEAVSDSPTPPHGNVTLIRTFNPTGR